MAAWAARGTDCAVDVQFVYEYLSTFDSNWLSVDRADVAPQHLLYSHFDHYCSDLIALSMRTMMRLMMMKLGSVRSKIEKKIRISK